MWQDVAGRHVRPSERFSPLTVGNFDVASSSVSVSSFSSSFSPLTVGNFDVASVGSALWRCMLAFQSPDGGEFRCGNFSSSRLQSSGNVSVP